MKQKIVFLIALVAISSGCASKKDMTDPDVLAAEISEQCNAHSQVAAKKGYRYMLAYGACMQNTLDYMNQDKKG